MNKGLTVLIGIACILAFIIASALNSTRTMSIKELPEKATYLVEELPSTSQHIVQVISPRGEVWIIWSNSNSSVLLSHKENK